MNRRMVIIGAASTFSISSTGCLGVTGNDDAPKSDDGDEGNNDEFPDLSVDGDEIPDDHESGLSASVEMFGQYSEGGPAQLKIAVTNQSDTSRDITFGSSPPFSDYRGEQEETEAVAFILPEDRKHIDIGRPGDSEEEPEEPVDGCWEIEGVSTDDIAKFETLEAGESLTETYSIFAAKDNENCFSTADFRFEEHWVNEPDTSPEFSVDWGFTLTVEDN